MTTVALRHPCRRRSGFTLIEVLATLVLLGIILPVAMRGISNGLLAASNARHMAEASSLAETKLQELTLSTTTTMSTGTQGDFSPDHPDYKWTCETAPRDYGMTEIALHVTWLERGTQKTFTLSTLYLPPDTTGSTSTTGGLP
jgi:prepilin-type N-terminal cleavage/methylation domain-containing protein